MIALYIILGILLLIFLILLVKVEVFASYTDDLTLTLKILFYKKQLLPAPEKPKKPQEKKEKKPEEPKPEEEKKPEKEKKPSYLEKLREKKGLSGILSLLTGLARIAVGTLKGLFSHLVIRKLNVGIALSSEDSATTAVNYGKLCSIVYPAVDVIVAATVCKSYNVILEPVFDDEKGTQITAEADVYLRPIFAVIEAVKAGVKLLILRIRL